MYDLFTKQEDILASLRNHQSVIFSDLFDNLKLCRSFSEALAVKLANDSDASRTHPSIWYSERVNAAINELTAPGTCTVTVVGADEHMVAIST